MNQFGLDDRHRDKNGEIGRKHGNTRVKTLRQIYGSNFASGLSPESTLADVLANLDNASLKKLVIDHQSGRLIMLYHGALGPDYKPNY